MKSLHLVLAAGIILAVAVGTGFFIRSRIRPSQDPLDSMRKSYSAGKLRETESGTRNVINLYAKSKDPAKRKQAAEAMHLQAFAAARQGKMKEARQEFAALRKEASTLPDKGKMPKAGPGGMDITLEEDAAFAGFIS